VSDTGGRYNYATVTAPLTRVAGRHSIYLVLTDGLRLATFSLR
jgi:beta-glucosidase